MKPLDVHATSPHSHAVSFAGFPNGTECLTASSLNQPTILLVDDDPDILCVTRAFLEGEGYRIVSCSDPRVALQLFRRLECVDLLVTDYHMPGLSGLELARELASLRPALPILMFSGSILDQIAVLEMCEKGWRFIAKPSRMPEFLSSIHSLLSVTGKRDKACPAE